MTTRTRINFWIDCISLIVMVVLAITGGLLYFVLPPGTGHSHSLFGFGRHDIGEVHFYFAVVGVVLLGVHVYLHWSWICGFIGKSLGSAVPSQTTWGVAFLSGILVLLGAGMWWTSSKVERNLSPGEQREYRDHDLFQRDSKVAFFESDEKQSVSNQQTPSDRENGDGSVPLTGITSSIHEKHLEDCPVGATINGRTTLSEAARKCRMSVEQIRKTLNLPNSVASGERLGRLKRRYGLSIHDVRRLACHR
jgi:hypothetical protein